TLPELLITVSIVGVLAALAMPSMGAMIKRARLAAAYNEFLSALYFLRSEATKRNRVVKMCRVASAGSESCAGSGSGWHTGWAVWEDWNSDDQINNDEPVIHTHTGLRGGVLVTGNSSVANRMAYQASGATAGVSNGTFTVCVPGVKIK